MADFLSRLDDRLSAGEVQDYLNKIPYPEVKAVLDNAIVPLTEKGQTGSASTQHHNQQVLAKPCHNPSDRDQQAK